MKNIAASVRDRLKNTTREQDIAFNTLLEHFALGRLLARLSQSAYADKFVLKGAQLFRIWNSSPHRPTRDVDFPSSLRSHTLSQPGRQPKAGTNETRSLHIL